MIAPPERSPARDAALDAVLPLVPDLGWTFRALRQAMADQGESPDDAALLFPGGATEMVDAYIDLADRRMADAAFAANWGALRTPGRVRAVIAQRLSQGRLHKEAIRRALAVLARPANAALSGRTLARTVDAVWDIVGDHSADFSWYTKRATLGAVYGATLLFWLQDGSEDDAETLAFLDRRLGGVARVGRARKRLEACLDRLGRNRAA